MENQDKDSNGEKYSNKYRIKSARLPTWDYASAGMYFITICTRNREHFFGEINENNEMHLSEIGKMADDEWLKTIELRPDMNLELDEYIVMPNHFHAILVIGENEFNTQNHLDPGRDAMHGGDAMHRVSTTASPYLGNKFSPQSKNLASVMRGYKSAVTMYARKNNIVFDWQTRFHDHIIRNHDEYIRISNYIMNNRLNWEQDKFFANPPPPRPLSV